MVRGIPAFADPNLLIGADHFSDAGVYRLREDLAVVQSTDFFSPLVNDPYLFGQIAAANAMGDIFAMGAEVKTALNIVAFPDNEADLSILNEILSGGAERVEAAGGVILGGHSVRDSEIKYGLAVTGIVHPERMLTNRGARAGDAIILTKGLGTGFITTALRFDRCPPVVLDGTIESMRQLNMSASKAAMEFGASAATDITGFGLAGHAFEMADASDVTIELALGALPLLPGAVDLATRDNLTRANQTNYSFVEAAMDSEIELELDRSPGAFLFDPQTSGGLLISIVEERADDLVQRLRGSGFERAARIGRVIGGSGPTRLRMTSRTD